ncbi:MAG TPA: hypothetical protein VJA94_19100 [Candidatus Angelobacter sp.]
MKRMLLEIFWALATIIMCGALSGAQSKSSVDLQEVLKWFPADTDAINVANGPFPLSGIRTAKDETESSESDEIVGDAQLVQVFATPAITLWTKSNTVIGRRLRGEFVLLAVQGFRIVTREHATQHCTILLFKRDSIDDKLLTPAAGPAPVPEDIDGRGFVVFEDTPLDPGPPSLIVAHPRPNVLLISDSLNYLRLVLDRIRGASDQALSETLADRRYVDTHARFWGVYHFRPADLSENEGTEDGAFARQLTSIGYSFDPGSRVARMAFFSNDHNLYQEMRSDNERDAANEVERHVVPVITEIAPGVVEMSAFLDDWYDTADFVTAMGLFVPGFEVNWFEWVPALD